MTIPALTDSQRFYLGKLIWTHIDGVAENVNGLIGAINRDVHSGVRVVATHEWERASAALHALQELVPQLEQWPAHFTIDHVLIQLRGVIEAHESHDFARNG